LLNVVPVVLTAHQIAQGVRAAKLGYIKVFAWQDGDVVDDKVVTAGYGEASDMSVWFTLIEDKAVVESVVFYGHYALIAALYKWPHMPYSAPSYRFGCN
jgi:hypothetical protein